MQIVIDIPEELYDAIKKNKYNLYSAKSCETMLDAIDNGIPLPKGHGRILDVDRLINELETKNVIDDGYIERNIEEYVDEKAEIIIDADKENGANV